MNAPGALLDWAESHGPLLAIAGAASLVLFSLTIIALPFVVLAIPADYFTRKKSPVRKRYQHPAAALFVLLLKNAAGLAFITAGSVMLVTPGQGLLTILAGLLLMNFPGKRRLELAIVSNHAVYRAISWIRARAGKPPVLLPLF